MYRDRESGNAPKQLNAVRCCSRAGERSAGPAVPYPARCASRFAAEPATRWRSPIGGRAAQIARPETPHFPSSRPSPAARPCRFGGEAARPPLPRLPVVAAHACCVSRRRPGAQSAVPPACFASFICSSASRPTRFGAELVRRATSRAGADSALPRPASEARFGAELVWRAISRAGADSALPRPASEARFGAELVWRTISRAGADSALPRPASEARFGAEAVRRAISRAGADTALPRSTSELRCAVELVRRTVSRSGADFAPPCSASVCRFAAEGGGAPFRTATDDSSSRSTSLRRSTWPPSAPAVLRCAASVSRRAGLRADCAPFTGPWPPVRRVRRGRSGS